MQPEPRAYKPGQWLIWGAALGAFIGLLLGKFAIGLIFGFFAGVVIDAARRKTSAKKGEGSDAGEAR